MRFSPIRTIVSLALVLAPALPAHADLFNITRIADTTTYSGFGGIAINDSGTVVFNNNDTGPMGIFSGSGGALTTIANTSTLDSSGFAMNYFYDPTINNSGQVAFSAQLAVGQNTGYGIYTGSGGGSVNTVANSLGQFSQFGGAVDINNSGTVAYRGFLDAGGSGLYVNNGGANTLLLSSTDPVYRSFGDPDINNNGQVAYLGALDPSPSGPTRVYRLEGSSPSSAQTVIADRANYPGLGSAVFQNDSGQVLFTNTAGVYVGNGSGTPTQIASNGGAYGNFFDLGTSINNQGQVVFTNQLDNGTTGIFNGADPVANRIIGTGDAFDGSTISGLAYYGGHGLNNNNQIAFAALLADGRQGIYRASIVATPEPSTWAMMFLGIGLMVVLIRSKRKEQDI
jgi:hypothetical protein